MTPPPSGPPKTQTDEGRVPSHVPGFDTTAKGGLPAGRVTLLRGAPGCGKTIFGCQFLHGAAIEDKEPGVFVTFEEPPAKIRAHMGSVGIEIPALEKEGLWTFIEGAPRTEDLAQVTGAYDLGALVARIGHAVKETGARRVVLDSFGAVKHRFTEPGTFRSQVLSLVTQLDTLGVTTIITDEVPEAETPGVTGSSEAFVVDNVVVLRNRLENENRRRTVEIYKFRGYDHLKGEFPFSIAEGVGLEVTTLLAGAELTMESTQARIPTGDAALDEILGGGYLRDGITLAAGPTGAGKTLVAFHSVRAGAENDERTLYLAFEESEQQIRRNARSLGFPLKDWEDSGHLKIMSIYPEMLGMEDHLVRIKQAIEAFRPHRLVLDSLSALERVSSGRSFGEFVVGITSLLKISQTATIMTSTTHMMTGGLSVTDRHVSTLADTIFLLDYFEVEGRLRRAFLALKMRGSKHDTRVHEYTIGDHGLSFKGPTERTTGILPRGKGGSGDANVPWQHLDDTAGS